MHAQLDLIVCIYNVCISVRMYMYVYSMCLCLIVHVRPYCSSACAPLYYYSGFFQQDLFHPFQSLPGPE